MFRVELLDGPVVLAYDDNWKRQGNVVNFTGGDRPALEQGTGSCYRVWCGVDHFDQRISGPGAPRTVIGCVVNFSNIQITLDQRWMQILDLVEEEGSLQLW